MEINLKDKTGAMSLNSCHSMFVGNKPEKITGEMFNSVISQSAKDSEKFGLFETSQPNYTTYYPDVTADDLLPKDEDFIYPVFRALSATVVWKGYKPIDFSKPGVLKSAMGLLIGQTINADHETAIGNSMGSVKDTFWQEAYTVAGKKIPAGINAEFKIDGKSNPRIARAILMDPPSIHSNSVSVRFKWEPSHSLEQNEFMNKLGTFDEKGNLYRLIVTEILQFTETSLVSHGADAYAQIIKDGKIINPNYADSVYKFSNQDDEGAKVSYAHSIDYKAVNELSLEFSKDTILKNNNLTNKEEKQMEALKIVAQTLGLKEDDINEENLASKITEALSSKETKVKEEEKVKFDAVENELTELKETTKDFEALKAKSDLYDENLSSERESVKGLYRLAKEVGEDVETDAILTMLDSADPTALAALRKDYQKTLDEKFKPSCKDCGSLNLSRRSSSEEGEEEEEDANLTGKILDQTQAREVLKANLKTKNKSN